MNKLLFQFSWIWLSFASGFAALIYQVLWMKKMTSIYGATAFSVSITLVAFFLGLSVGSYAWGKWSPKFKAPFKALACIELGILIGNLSIYVLSIYLESVSVYLMINKEDLGNWTSSVVKFTLVLLLLFPTSFFLGGTYPIMVKAFSAIKKGPLSTAIYGLNTAGACLGALLGGTAFPLLWGYRGTGLLALAITFSVVLGSWILSKQNITSREFLDESNSEPATRPQTNYMWMLCFISGFASLGLEVLWTHMFAQVLQNSVYSYACILTLFLLTQAFGAGLISLWSRKKSIGEVTLGLLLCMISLLVLATPFLFYWSTNGMSLLGGDGNLSFTSYILDILVHISYVILLPSLAIGCLFPILIHWSSQNSQQIGVDLGKWVSVNTLGAIMGSLITGFFLIPNFGTWTSIRLLACLYVCLLLYPRESSHSYLKNSLAYVGMIIFIISITVADPTKLPLIQLMEDQGEILLDVKEDEEGVVGVVQKDKHLSIIVNNSYTLGGTKSSSMEEFQSHLPIVLHPEAKSIFYLGMGTGITAGASLRFKFENIVVSELVKNSIEASKTYFQKWNGGLFQDPRVQIVHGDGRQILKHTTNKFDLIIADLFLPWKRGSSNLFSLEHYKSVHEKLEKGGSFTQWLPLYQLTRDDFDIIAKTMLEVFPQVTVWRGDYYSERPILCLIGHREPEGIRNSLISNYSFPYYPLLLRKKLDSSHPKIANLLKYYIGSLDKKSAEWASIPINTENHPIIEFWAPIHQREVRAGKKSWFNGSDYLSWMERLHSKLNRDSYVGEQPNLHSYINSGYLYHRLKIMKKRGDANEIKLAEKDFKESLSVK